MSMVLLMTLNSVAENVRKVWFQRVKVTAVFTTASQPIISPPVKSSLGGPSTSSPIPSNSIEPMPMLTTVTVSGLSRFWRFMPRPMKLDKEVAIIWIPAMREPTAIPVGKTKGLNEEGLPDEKQQYTGPLQPGLDFAQ